MFCSFAIALVLAVGMVELFLFVRIRQVASSSPKNSLRQNASTSLNGIVPRSRVAGVFRSCKNCKANDSKMSGSAWKYGQ
jgi:hypothetical protein